MTESTDHDTPASAEPDRVRGRDLILIAGLWLDHSVWDDVAVALRRLGHRPIPVALPGAGDGRTDATLDDQVAAVITAIDSADRPVVVGHSAACSLAWVAADRRPDAVPQVVMIGGFPTPNGGAYADFFPIADGAMAFPGWEAFEGPDSADLDDEARSRFAAGAIPVPEGVARGVVSLNDVRRFEVPVTLICPEFGPDEAKAWIAGGELPELAAAHHVSFVDIDSGHWPMVTRPAELARLLGEIVTED